MQDVHVVKLEEVVNHLNAGLPALKEFVLPGGTRAAGAAHLARTIARRAERSMVALGRDEAVSPAALQYLNRLSDLLFIAARVINRAAGRPEPTWHR
jgi:cob(I)alamin adenosyltransferase